MANRLGILQTKLHRPYVTDDFVSRERLLDQLNKQPRRPLTLVSAPAGYGKSTLVSGWREMCESPTAWLSLDEDDNDLARFLQYFVAAVESIHEGACPVTASLLEARTRLKPSVFAQTLLNELDQIQTPYALVLDDYNQIQESEIHTFVGELIQYPPRSLHLVLVTRRDPPISLHLLRAHGKLVEIRAQDLRFTASETDTFLHNVLGQQIDVDTVVTLTEKTERLATLSLHQFDSINALSTQLPQDARFVTDYLLAEVFERLPTDVQNFLLKTSILDWLCGPLCDAVVAMDEPERNGKAYLDWLHRQNLFTIPLDDRREWYRYHHLFQRLLRLQLRNTMANCIPTLHNRASDWFARNGLIDEALHHALASGDDLSVVRLVEENRHTPLNDDRWYVLQIWLDHIPGQLLEQRPALLMARAWIVSYLGTLWTLPPILESVKQLGQLEGLEQDLLGELRFFEGVVRFWDREVLHSRMLFREALDLMSTKHVGARNEAEIYYAVASQMTGDSAAVVASFL
jgi:LuxR family maltose regulon positive regulatory protein